ncbi:hypothetical protein [Paraburkholderia sp. UCT2]|uniref:hypothetical protein n=1 Tax=Paraburkholderia sp. UCT2 TaxID=2615208 RepID=UPI0016557942|nr:hypothetical protein [Paraburkholderia sp. UCT2]MBC8732435.1 hypothetical protein [Paraburkholderia sp. UCT2]
MSALRIFLLCLILSLTGAASFAEFIDSKAHDIPLLKTLAPALDKHGIDVRGGALSSDAFSGNRPQLAPLDTLPAGDLAIAAAPNRFGQLFEVGVFTDAYLVATRTRKHRKNVSEIEFRRKWEAANKANRVFISFNGSDLGYAEIVRSALEANGYLAFLYKDSASKYPKTNSVQVGKYFKEAGNYFVVDSSNARISLGVITEALALDAMKRGSHATFPFDPAKKSESDQNDNQDREGKPCCELCTYQGSVLLSCRPLGCGSQCYGAH